MAPISSLQNPLIKQIQKLSKSRERSKQNLILVEGLRECRLAIDEGFKVNRILFCDNYISDVALKHALNLTSSDNLVDVSPELFDTLVYRKGLPNCLGLLEPKIYSMDELRVTSNPLILVIDSIEKPGNLGAMLRTCDAAGVDAVFVCDPLTDVYNPNCIRASLGAAFTMKVIVCTAEDCIEWLKNNFINTFITYLESARNYTLEDYTEPTAIVVGSEAFGIKDIWLNTHLKHIIIPQFGKVDSMNVANSAAIIIYEAIRQRGLKS